jgi:aryl-alcohol dehydrogenase-like predicted oxidoreductase
MSTIPVTIAVDPQAAQALAAVSAEERRKIELLLSLRGLAWLLAHDPGTLLIPGTRSTEHLAENMAAADVHLDAVTMAKLDALAPAC